MKSTALSLDQLQERLGELLVVLLLDANTHRDNFDADALLSGFGQLIDAMQQIEYDTSAVTGRHAGKASALGKTAYQLLQDLAERLLAYGPDNTQPIRELHTEFAHWVIRQGGIAIPDIVNFNDPAKLHASSVCNHAQHPLPELTRHTLH